MDPQHKTIIALSSGALPSGVAVVRISGPKVRDIILGMFKDTLEPRKASLRVIRDMETGEAIDTGLAILFEGPNSFTGEDCLELQVHGGRAVVSALLDSILKIDGTRLAEAGEFSRRAFENGRLDLTEIEGLSDLIAAETEAQRRLALSQSQGQLRELYEGWRKRLIHMRAMIEAELDFSEEEDVPTDISSEGLSRIATVSCEISNHLSDNSAGEIIRDGFEVALMGKPNAGKSRLLNALAKRDAAIVTEVAGTTRDVIDVNLDLNGYAVTISDTAGIRKSDSLVEQEGIRRAEMKGRAADLVIWLYEIGSERPDVSQYPGALYVKSKDDDGIFDGHSVSSKTGYGIVDLIGSIGKRIEDRLAGHEFGLVTRMRYRLALQECLQHMDNAQSNRIVDVEVRAESLRLAGDCLARITGRIDVEDLLDVIFSEFCVGK